MQSAGATKAIGNQTAAVRMLLRNGNSLGIIGATHIPSEGFSVSARFRMRPSATFATLSIAIDNRTSSRRHGSRQKPASEHGQATPRLGARGFILQHVPMFGEFCNSRYEGCLRRSISRVASSRKTTVDNDEITFRPIRGPLRALAVSGALRRDRRGRHALAQYGRCVESNPETRMSARWHSPVC